LEGARSVPCLKPLILSACARQGCERIEPHLSRARKPVSGRAVWILSQSSRSPMGRGLSFFASLDGQAVEGLRPQPLGSGYHERLL
jgi:hypothetical protein